MHSNHHNSLTGKEVELAKPLDSRFSSVASPKSAENAVPIVFISTALASLLNVS